MNKPKRIILPPIWLVFGISAIFALNEYLPGYRFTSAASQLGGGVILVAGLVLLIYAGGLFKRAETGLVPFSPVTTLVTAGVYRRSRNPMYLGMALVLLGCAVTVGAVSALLVPPLFMVIITARYILPEETLLQHQFGDAYREYCARVRRWV